MIKTTPVKNGLKGEITIPGDKSISHRSIMFASLANGDTKITGFLPSDDCMSTISCFRKLGVDIDVHSESEITVHGNGLHGLKAPSELLYTGNSGTTTRLMMGILAGQPFTSEIDGDSSIRKRPMARVADPLRMMGAKISGDLCPLSVSGGKLNAIEYELPVASAQLKSSLILAGLYANGTTCISEPVKSRNHTEIMLKYMGADIKEENSKIYVSPTKNLNPIEITVPGDISSAAYFITAGIIVPDSEITIKNVGLNETRSGIIDVYKAMGANVKIENVREAGGELVGDITVKHSELIGTVIKGDIIPRLIDEIPVIAVAAAMAKGKTIIADAEELKVKESNRITATVTELKKCGIDITETEDGMIINGGNEIMPADFCGYDDHRMIMSEYILSMKANGNCSIDDEKAVSISFPEFFETVRKIIK